MTAHLAPAALAALVRGDDDDAAHEHLDGCDACRRALAEATRAFFHASFGAAAAGDEVAPGPDRYLVIDILGAGATGVVYAAYDTRLDRKVALKLVHAGGAEWSARLVREAKLLAQVSHPNVVAVHDVGVIDDRVYLAMELVDGSSLASWLAQEPRSHAEIVDVFVQCARGLDAAHAAGIIHRDFKPDNVLVGSDGRARVADFGLARAGDGGTEIVGTPAYIAPEQLAGASVDGRADQFSFCVALHEAIYGELPGSGRPRANASAHVRACIARGLAAQPDARFPSMRALADALAVDPRARRTRRVVIGAVAVSVIAVGVAGRAALVHGRPAPCEDASDAIATAWSPDRAASLARAFAATGAPFAADVERTTRRAFDAYATGWTAMHREACEATRVRGEQSDELFDLRMACLAARRDDLRALVDVLARGDAAVLERAASAAGKLPRLDACANVAALRSRVPASSDPAARVHVETERARIASARALGAVGRYREALPLATEAASEARSARDRPGEAEALALIGRLDVEGDDLKAAEAALLDAVVAAEAGRDDAALAEVMGASAFVVGYGEARYPEGEAWARQALAIVDRLGGDDAIAGRVLDNLGALRFRQGRYGDAIATDREAIAHLERALGADHLELANAHNNLGAPLEALGRYGEALAEFRRALAIYEAQLGPSHPDVALAHNNVGSALRDLGQLDDAAAELERSLAIKEQTLGATHPQVAASLENLANTRKDLHDYDRALALLARARDIRSATGTPLELAIVHRDTADVLAAAGRFDLAFDEYRAAIDAQTASLGADHPKVIESRLNRAEALVHADRARDALAEYAAVLAIAGNARALARYVPYASAGVGEAQLALGSPRDAIAPLEHALSAWQGGDVVAIEQARFALARALWDTGEHARAGELARAAWRVLRDAGPLGAAASEEVERWLHAR